jgi:hypothetical protein
MLDNVNGKYHVTAKEEKKQKAAILTIQNSIDRNDLLPIQIGGNSFYTRYLQNKKYLPFLGSKDDLPNLLLTARLISPTHSACITSIAKSVIGKGLYVVDNENPNPDFMQWQKSVNNKRQSLNRLLRNCVEGEREQGNQFIEIVRGQIAGKKFLKIYLQPMLDCRLNNPDDGEPNAVIISVQFEKTGYAYLKDDVTVIPLWSPEAIDQPNVWLEDDKGFQHTMLHFKNEVSNIKHYGIPASYAALEHVILENKIVKYNSNDFDNNMMPGGIAAFKSATTKEEAEQQVSNMVDQYTGNSNIGKIIFVSSENGVEDFDFKQFYTTKDGSFIELDKRTEEKIITGHCWDGELAGIYRASQLGNGSQSLRATWDRVEANLLSPYTHELIDEVIYPIQQIYADWFGVKEVADYEMWFQRSMPYSFSSDVQTTDVAKINEQRELIGLPNDGEKGDLYLWELKSKNQNNNVQSPPNTTQDVNNNG